MASENKYLSILYTCEPYYCKFVSSSESEFLNHIASHICAPMHNKYECTYCCELFETYGELFLHIQNTYTRMEFECVHCATYFETKARFEDHVCEKTVNIDEVYMTMSECREMDYIMFEKCSLLFHSALK